MIKHHHILTIVLKFELGDCSVVLLTWYKFRMESIVLFCSHQQQTTVYEVQLNIFMYFSIYFANPALFLLFKGFGSILCLIVLDIIVGGCIPAFTFHKYLRIGQNYCSSLHICVSHQNFHLNVLTRISEFQLFL